jgi:hypothetical protein
MIPQTSILKEHEEGPKDIEDEKSCDNRSVQCFPNISEKDMDGASGIENEYANQLMQDSQNGSN